jgi:hypothetical protein
MTGTTLRELARAYAKGELGREEYRRSRSDLVASILSGEVVVKNLDFPPPLKFPGGDGQDATEPRQRRRHPDARQEPETTRVGQAAPPPVRAPGPAPAPAQAVNQADSSRGIWLFAGVVALGAVIAAGIFMASKRSGDSATLAVGEPAAPVTKPATDDPAAAAGRALISRFLQDRNWSGARLASFRSDWSALDSDQRAAALKSADAGRLASAVYQRLLEERALSGLGDAQSSLDKQRELVAFAGAIGIRDPRLTVPEPAAGPDPGAAPAEAAVQD